MVLLVIICRIDGLGYDHQNRGSSDVLKTPIASLMTFDTDIFFSHQCNLQEKAGGVGASEISLSF